MADQRKIAKVQTGNPPTGQLRPSVFTREAFMRDLKKVSRKKS
jgi:hypothetical protein